MSVDTASGGWTGPRLRGALRSDLRLEPIPAAAGQARRFLREHLADLPRETLELSLLVVTELVTNAVLHARTVIDVTLEHNADAVLIRVFDCEPAAPTPRPHDHDRPDGRGITLVEAVSEQWGTAVHNDGKTVWAVITRPGAASEDPAPAPDAQG